MTLLPRSRMELCTITRATSENSSRQNPNYIFPRRATYVHKAVVEVEAEQRGGDLGVVAHGRSNAALHDAEHRRARALVEARGEPVAVGGCGGEDNEQADQACGINEPVDPSHRSHCLGEYSSDLGAHLLLT
jgi:hypothetical protein